ncbi:MAG TPA: TIGR02757 family protein [Victivallales bacterium]|nr:TIGR02757 family protein [Victivallales bacterium]
MSNLKRNMEYIYSNYNKYNLIHPDPLEFLYNYSDNRDIEIVGLIASSLAYGRVAQILKSIAKILSPMESSPYNYIIKYNFQKFSSDFKDFKHRFTTEKDIVNLILGIKNTLETFGSIKQCFTSCYSENDDTYTETLEKFTKIINKYYTNNNSYLLPSPKNGSACKRLMLFLRWMIRKDHVDIGCWDNLPMNKLIIPLDTHMFFISKNLNFTKRKAADLKTAIEITDQFKKLDKDDPVKYDFPLTRFGIREDFEYHNLFTTLLS